MACAKKHFIKDRKIFSTTEFEIKELEKGCSIYEVVKIINSRSLFIDSHIERLNNSAKLHNKIIWISKQEIKNRVNKLIEINQVEKGRLKFAFRFYNNQNIFFLFFLKRY